MRKDVTQTEINEHDLASSGDEDVGRFDVAMDHQTRVAVRDGTGKLPCYPACCALSESSILLGFEMLFETTSCFSMDQKEDNEHLRQSSRHVNRAYHNTKKGVEPSNGQLPSTYSMHTYILNWVSITSWSFTMLGWSKDSTSSISRLSRHKISGLCASLSITLIAHYIGRMQRCLQKVRRDGQATPMEKDECPMK